MAQLKVYTANGREYELTDPNWNAADYLKQSQDPNIQQVSIGDAIFNKHTIIEVVPVTAATSTPTTPTTNTTTPTA